MALERTDYTSPATVPYGKRVTDVGFNLFDVLVIEDLPIQAGKFERLPYGSPHPDYANNGLVLVLQGKITAENNQIKARRVYANRTGTEDWYNWSLDYSGDASANPIFVRAYVEERSQYAAPVFAAPFTGVYLLRVTAGGSGYTSAPAVTFSGGGSPTAQATANAIMSPEGAVIGLEMLTEGEGYTSAPTIGFSGGGGTGATAIALIQPVNAVLVKEKIEKLHENIQSDSQLASLFIRVVRIYETLPGPWLYATRTDEHRNLIYTKKRRQLATAIVSSDTITAGIWTKVTQGEVESEVVAWEVVETNQQFPGFRFSIDTQDPVPPEFRSLFPTRSIAFTEEGEAEPPTLALGEISKDEAQETYFTRRLATTYRDLTELPKTLREVKTSGAYGFGGIMNVDKTLDKEPQTVEHGLNVVSSSVKELAGGLTLKETEKLAITDIHLELTNGGQDYTSTPDIVFPDNTAPGGAVGTAITTVLTPPEVTVDLNHSYNGDARGVFYYLGSRGNNGTWENPQTSGQIDISSPNAALEQGTFNSIVDRQPSNTYLASTANAIFKIDLGPGRLLKLNRASYRQRTGYNSPCAGFGIQGSVDDSIYVNLDFMDVDTDQDVWTSMAIDSAGIGYRYFLLILPNGQPWFTIGELELYGQLHLDASNPIITVTGVTMSAGGVYSSRPAVVFSGGGGTTQAQGVAVWNSITGAVTGVQVTYGGLGYTSDPAVGFTGGLGGGGTIGTGHAVVGRSLKPNATIDNGGSGYLYPPTVVIDPVVSVDGIVGGGAVGVAVLARGVQSVRVLNPGSALVSAPDVTFEGGGGTGATATSILGKTIASLALTAPGSGFISDPTVVIDPPTGGGIQATAHAIFGAGITAPVLTAGGSGYGASTTVVFTGGGGTGAAATLTRSFGVASAAVTGGGGTGFTSPPTVAFDAPPTGGVLAVATAALGLASAAVVAGGTGYTVGDILTLVGGTGAIIGQLQVATAPGGIIGTVTVLTVGAYSVVPGSPVSVTGGTGTGATFTPTWLVSAITVTTAGSGYLTTPAMTVTGGGGTGAGATATLATTGPIASITLTNPGSSYTSTPAITFGTPGGGTGAYAGCALGPTSTVIGGLVIDDPGSGYTAVPGVTISGGGGTGATATASLSSTGSVKSVTVTAPGTGFTSTPVVHLKIGGVETNATAEALVGGGGSVVAVNITHGGSKYTAAPVIRFLPGGSGGTGAAATAVLEPAGPVVATILDTPGDYVVAPLVTIENGGGTGATCLYVFGEGWKVLHECFMDELTKIVINVRKEMVEAGTLYPGSGFVEIKALDFEHSVKLTSELDEGSLPAPKVWSTWEHYTFPSELLVVRGVWSVRSTRATSGVLQFDGTHEGNSFSISVSGSAITKIKHGYSGPCYVEITRTYMLHPPTCADLPEPFLILPSSGTAIIAGSSSASSTQNRPVSALSVPGSETQNLSASTSSGSSIGAHQIGPILTGSFIVQDTTPPGGGGSLVVDIPPSTPAAFSPCDVFIADVRVLEMRFDIWRVDVVRLTVPPCACVALPPEAPEELWITF